MKFEILTITTKRDPLYTDLVDLFLKKIKPLHSIELTELKGKKIDRTSSSEKQSQDCEILLDKISNSDFVVLLDEKGKNHNSQEWAAQIQKLLNSSKSKIIFVIGGPYGFDEKMRSRANLTLSLSQLTFNHHLALVVLLEQIYRGFSILRGLPYHNE